MRTGDLRKIYTRLLQIANTRNSVFRVLFRVVYYVFRVLFRGLFTSPFQNSLYTVIQGKSDLR